MRDRELMEEVNPMNVMSSYDKLILVLSLLSGGWREIREAENSSENSVTPLVKSNPHKLLLRTLESRSLVTEAY